MKFRKIVFVHFRDSNLRAKKKIFFFFFFWNLAKFNASSANSNAESVFFKKSKGNFFKMNTVGFVCTNKMVHQKILGTFHK